MAAINNNIEYIVTIHCKYCGEITSLDLPLIFEQAQKTIQDFNEEHDHPNPWMV